MIVLSLWLLANPARATGEPASARVDPPASGSESAVESAVESAEESTGEPAAKPVPEPEVLTVLTWGGSYEASQRAAYFDPFTRETGIVVRTVRYDGGLAELGREVASGAPAWDVVDLETADARAACRNGLLEPFDADILLTVDGVPPDEDFDPDAIGDCWVSQLVFSTVVAYDVRAFPGEKPRRIADFFDVERFPGKRGLRCAPVALLEWALLVHDVPRSQVYDLLSTSRGLDLAFRQLDRIAPHIVWWRGGDEPAGLLGSGEVTMSSGYNGRFFDAQIVAGAPISVLWDAQLLARSAWAIPRGAARPERAEAFIRFATRPARMADQAMRISYAPTRASARRRIGLHVDAGVDMNAHLPTGGDRTSRAVVEDSDWYARTETLRERRFAEWMAAADVASCRAVSGRADHGPGSGQAREPAGDPTNGSSALSGGSITK